MGTGLPEFSLQPSNSVIARYTLASNDWRLEWDSRLYLCIYLFIKIGVVFPTFRFYYPGETIRISSLKGCLSRWSLWKLVIILSGRIAADDAMKDHAVCARSPRVHKLV